MFHVSASESGRVLEREALRRASSAAKSSGMSNSDAARIDGQSRARDREKGSRTCDFLCNPTALIQYRVHSRKDIRMQLETWDRVVSLGQCGSDVFNTPLRDEHLRKKTLLYWTIGT